MEKYISKISTHWKQLINNIMTYKIKFQTDNKIKVETLNQDTISDAIQCLIALYGQIVVLRIRIA